MKTPDSKIVASTVPIEKNEDGIILVKQKDRAYRERNILLAGIANFLHGLPHNPYNVYQTTDINGEKEWNILLVINPPNIGQMAWHFHISEIILLEDITWKEAALHKYDGHSTYDKYENFCLLFGLFAGDLLELFL